MGEAKAGCVRRRDSNKEKRHGLTTSLREEKTRHDTVCVVLTPLNGKNLDDARGRGGRSCGEVRRETRVCFFNEKRGFWCCSDRRSEKDREGWREGKE